jgi:hypothetical protein
MNNLFPMKTALQTILIATLLGAAILASGRLIDAADLAVLFFTTGLVAWTIAQYRRQPRMINLDFARPVRLPVGSAARRPSRGSAQLAA